jgi:hypothetical protein
MAALRAALETREANSPRDTFDVNDLVACNPKLRDFSADEINKLAHANMRVLGIAPAGLGVGMWRFGLYVEPKSRSLGGR